MKEKNIYPLIGFGDIDFNDNSLSMKSRIKKMILLYEFEIFNGTKSKNSEMLHKMVIEHFPEIIFTLKQKVKK